MRPYPTPKFAMHGDLLMGLVILAIFIAAAVYVQNRGAVQHSRFTRKLTDHSNFIAPINCLFYFFSKKPQSVYIDLKQFPELTTLQENWQVIRDEAINLNAAAQIKASD